MSAEMLPYRDPRVDAIISDPAGYFAAARVRAHEQAQHVLAERLEQFHRNGLRRLRPRDRAAVILAPRD